jgi:hypothetical protein
VVDAPVYTFYGFSFNHFSQSNDVLNESQNGPVVPHAKTQVVAIKIQNFTILTKKLTSTSFKMST